MKCWQLKYIFFFYYGKIHVKEKLQKDEGFFSKSYFRMNILPYFEVWEGFFSELDCFFLFATLMVY